MTWFQKVGNIQWHDSLTVIPAQISF